MRSCSSGERGKWIDGIRQIMNLKEAVGALLVKMLFLEWWNYFKINCENKKSELYILSG